MNRLAWPLAWALVSLPAAVPADSMAESLLYGEGRIVAINETNGALTVDHGPIGERAGLTRTEFPVERREWLRDLRVGDRIAFSLAPELGSQGVLAITRLDVLPPDVRPPDAWVPAVPLRWAGAAAGAMAAGTLLLLGLTFREVRRLGRLTRRHDLDAVFRDQHELQRETRRDLLAAAHALADIASRLARDIGHLSPRVAAARGAATGNDRLADARPELPLAVVRAGELETLTWLQDRLGRPGLARVIWDRRKGERRSRAEPAVPERRRRERRGPVPITWSTLGYLIVEWPRRLTVVA